MNVDSLQAVIAELRAGVAACHADSITQAAMRASWEAIALRLERIDAEHGLTVGLYEGIVRLREDCIEELRERLAAAEKDAERYRKIQHMGFTPPNDRFGRVLFGDKLGVWIDGRKSPPDAIAAEAREKAPPSK